jgi:hypothetical protein
MSFAFLVDGDTPQLSHEDYLLNVDVRQSAEQRVELTAVGAVLAGTVLLVGGCWEGWWLRWGRSG